MNPNIFRSYDVRGIYGTDLTADTARLIGKAFVSLIIRKYAQKNPHIVVGKDNRTHGPELQNAFVAGLMEHGAEVSVIDSCASPMLYFAAYDGAFDAGVNITASHNSSNYNGFKLVGRKAHSIFGDEIYLLRKMIQDQDFEPMSSGHRTNFDATETYMEKIDNLVKLNRRLKIVADAGNGIAGKYYPDLFRRLGCEVVELYCDQDGSFPNHEPDPVVEENTKALKELVLLEKADLGLSFDGDGDRLAVVDEQGIYHDANESFVLLIRDILPRHAGSTVVYTVSNSLMVPEEIEKCGGVGVMVPVGHSYVEQAMEEHHAFLGGEQSGHFFVAENYYSYDDAAYTAAKLLQIFAASEQPVSALYGTIPKVFSHPELRPFCADDRKFKVIEEITKELSKNYKCNTMDGVRVEFEDGSWLGVRASNTSPCLSICLEARDQKKLDEVFELAKKSLREFGVEVDK